MSETCLFRRRYGARVNSNLDFSLSAELPKSFFDPSAVVVDLFPAGTGVVSILLWVAICAADYQMQRELRSLLGNATEINSRPIVARVFEDKVLIRLNLTFVLVLKLMADYETIDEHLVLDHNSVGCRFVCFDALIDVDFHFLGQHVVYRISQLRWGAEEVERLLFAGVVGILEGVSSL